MATESDNVNSGALGTLVAVGTIAFFGIALVVTALVRAETAEEVEKKEVSADRPYRDLVAEQTAKLAAPASYVDRAKGLVALPIERAMELTVESLKKDPNSATPAAASAGSAGTGGAAAEGTGGAGGAGGSSAVKPADEAVHAENKPEEPKPAEEPKNQGAETKGEDGKEKKKAPKPAAPVPAAPAPAAPAPATPAPAPTPNGQ